MDGGLGCQYNPFVMEWEVLESNKEMTIPTQSTQSGYNFMVSWGDGYVDSFADGVAFQHTYKTAGTYEVKIVPMLDDDADGVRESGFPSIHFSSGGQNNQLKAITAWGDVQWATMNNAFANCDNLQVTATDAPDLSVCKDLSNMFASAGKVNFDVSGWNVSNIETMERMFYHATAFNNGDAANNGLKPIAWGAQTAKVTTMKEMFNDAEAFNQSVSGWDVRALTTTQSMFAEAVLFNNGEVGNTASKSLAWLVPTTAVLTDVSHMFGAKQTSAEPVSVAFNQDVKCLKTDKVTDYANMFINARFFDQDISSFQIANVSSAAGLALNGASNMLDNTALSVENYDKLLISWEAQVKALATAGTPKTNVRFGAAGVKYCAGADARDYLIAQGWGDQSTTNNTINDGGSIAPDVSGVEVEALSIFQKEDAIITLAALNTTVNYYVQALDATGNLVGEATMQQGDAAGLTFNMGEIDETTSYRVWAKDANDCDAEIETAIVEVHPAPDLIASTVEVTTAAVFKAANGTDAHTVKVTVVDKLGEILSGATVKFKATPNATFTPNASQTTDENGVVTYSITSLKAAEYSTVFTAQVSNPDDVINISKGDISTPAIYTFGADKPDMGTGKSSVVKLTQDTVAADGVKTHRFLVKLLDANDNPVPNVNVKFAATDPVSFYYYTLTETDSTKVSVAANTDLIAPTRADGTLRVYATSTKAWTEFSTAVSHDYDNDGTYETITGSPMKYSYVNGEIYVANSSITATPDKQVVGSPIILTITLLDKYHNAVRGQQAVFKKAQLQSNDATTNLVRYDGSTYANVTKTTDDNGQATVTAESETAGLYKTVGTVKVLDSEGNEVTAANGVPVRYEFTAAAPQPTNDKTKAIVVQDNSPANEVAENEIKATISDQYGNLIKGARVKISADANINWGSGYNAEQILTTNVSGEVLFKGFSNLGATYTTIVSVETSTDVWEAINPTDGLTHTFIQLDTSKSTVVITGSPATADGVDYVTATIQLRDQNDNPLGGTGYVHIAKTDNVTATVVSDDRLTILPNGDWLLEAVYGAATIRGFSTVAGEYTTTFSVCDDANGSNPRAFDAPSYNFVAGPVSTAKSTVHVSYDNAVVGNRDTILVRLADQYDNPILQAEAETQVVFAATEGVSINGGAVGAAYTHTLNAGDNGTFGIPVSSEIAGEYSTAVSFGGTPLQGSPAVYHFVAGAPDATINSYYEVTTNGAHANSAQRVTIKAYLKDALGNPVPNINVRFKNNNASTLNFGIEDYESGLTSTDANGEATVNISSTQIGRYNSEVAYTLSADWSDETSYVQLPSSAGGTAVAAPFYFIDDFTTVDEANGKAIRAQWYVVEQSMALSHMPSLIAGLKAWNLTGSPDYLTATASTMPSNAVGPHNMTFTHESSSRTVIASVADDFTTLELTEELALRAESYHLTTTQAQGHTLADVLNSDCAHAKAWNLSNGTDLTNTTNITVDATQLAAIQTGNPSTYQLELTLNEDGRTVTRTIAVTVIADDAWFITKWNVGAGETITIPTNGEGYDFVVNWGDGNHPESFMDGDNFSHTYTNAGPHIIKIAGTFPHLFFNNGDEGQQKNKIISVDQWGKIEWQTMADMFEGCANLTINATDYPVMTYVTDMQDMFTGATNMNSANLKGWDVSTVENMLRVFHNATNFNQDLSGWNTVKVTNMQGMFYGATKFNNGGMPLAQEAGKWNVSSVSNMSNMFQGATAFDQSLASWDISSLTNAENMLKNAELSLANYDATLISWSDKVDASNGNANVKFHGGKSKYCVAATQRENLISKGWGDGALGGSPISTNATGIIDGGSALPEATVCFAQSLVEICQGEQVTLTLQESKVGVEYQLHEMAGGLPVAKGTRVAGNGGSITFGPFTPTVVEATGMANYLVEMFVAGYDVCTTYASCQATVSVAPPTVAGAVTLQGSTEITTTVCASANETILSLSGHTGEVIRWESSSGGTFNNPMLISNATATLTVSNIHSSRSYRAVVQSGACAVAYSEAARIEVDAISVGGTVSPATQEAYAGTTVTFDLSGHVGDVIRWESSATGDFDTDAVVINDSETIIMTGILTDNIYYRAVVKNGVVCDEAYSSPAFVKVIQFDYGDAPTSYGAAFHAVVAGEEKIYLGTMKPDTETTQPYSDDAKGDDDNAAENDEDALTNLNYTTDGSKITFSNIAVANTSGARAYLAMWLDGNQDGVFDSDEIVGGGVKQVSKGGSIINDLETKNYNYQLKPGSYFVRIRVGSVPGQVGLSAGFAQDGEVEDYMICVRPKELKPDDINVKICASTTEINLNDVLHYAGTGTVTWMENDEAATLIEGTDITAHDVSGMEAEDMKMVHYKIAETFCGEEVTGSATVYIKAMTELNIADKTVKVCVDDAESLNLSSLLGIAEAGTWTAETVGTGAYLSNGRFDGKSAYGIAETDQTYVFTFTPETGSCITTTPKLTIVITKEL
ncbi:MAG: BspA family leucine-rich repeat surface protein [Mangrovibacterium sp.]